MSTTITKPATGVAMCRRCGRLLTDPVSVDAGIGPVCRSQSDAERVAPTAYPPETVDPPESLTLPLIFRQGVPDGAIR